MYCNNTKMCNTFKNWRVGRCGHYWPLYLRNTDTRKLKKKKKRHTVSLWPSRPHEFYSVTLLRTRKLADLYYLQYRVTWLTYWTQKKKKKKNRHFLKLKFSFISPKKFLLWHKETRKLSILVHTTSEMYQWQTSFKCVKCWNQSHKSGIR